MKRTLFKFMLISTMAMTHTTGYAQPGGGINFPDSPRGSLVGGTPVQTSFLDVSLEAPQAEGAQAAEVDFVSENPEESTGLENSLTQELVEGLVEVTQRLGDLVATPVPVHGGGSPQILQGEGAESPLPVSDMSPTGVATSLTVSQVPEPNPAPLETAESQGTEASLDSTLPVEDCLGGEPSTEEDALESDGKVLEPIPAEGPSGEEGEASRPSSVVVHEASSGEEVGSLLLGEPDVPQGEAETSSDGHPASDAGAALETGATTTPSHEKQEDDGWETESDEELQGAGPNAQKTQAMRSRENLSQVMAHVWEDGYMRAAFLFFLAGILLRLVPQTDMQ